MNVRINSKGQVTIPQAIRERFGLMPNTDVEFLEIDGLLTLQGVDARKSGDVDAFIASLTGSGAGALSTDEIMELSRGYSEDD